MDGESALEELRQIASEAGRGLVLTAGEDIAAGCLCVVGAQGTVMVADSGGQCPIGVAGQPIRAGDLVIVTPGSLVMPAGADPA